MRAWRRKLPALSGVEFPTTPAQPELVEGHAVIGFEQGCGIGEFSHNLFSVHGAVPMRPLASLFGESRARG
jgi:hypothetical protein